MIAYFDCFSGISGDMILGALVDAGVSPEQLRKELSRIPVKGYALNVKRVKRAGIRATKVDVLLKAKGQRQKAVSRQWKDIDAIIRASGLSDHVKQRGLSIFKRLFKAEAKVHGGRYDRVHLHELGAVDCIIDVFGCLIGLDILGIEKVCSSALNLGSGMTKTEHGMLPVPAPAAVELLKNVPVYSSDIPFELTTPTGAALISSLAEEYGTTPAMNISVTGTGAGNKNFQEQPNVLRLFVGREEESREQTRESRGQKDDQVIIIETNIDDMNPQVYEYVMDLLLQSGALDVFLSQIIMKKARPGIQLTVLCSEDAKENLTDIILRETTSIGVRFYRADRKILQREIKELTTKFGTVHVKVSHLEKKIRKISAEYEDCKKIAKRFHIPLIEILRTVTKG